VDVSNPRWPQQVASVERILEDLKFAQLPSILALNKADLVEADTLAGIRRQLSQNGERPVVSLSAIDSKSLQPLLEKVGEMLVYDLGLTTDETSAEPDIDAATLSRIA
jgi:GTP-binding protein HflX